MAAKKSKDKPKRPRGRPPKTLTEEQYQQVSKMAGLFLTQEEIGILLDVSERKIRYLIEQDARFAAEYKKGLCQAKAHTTKKLRQLIEEGEPSAIFFALKTKFGFRETPKEEVKQESTIIAGFKVVPYEDE